MADIINYLKEIIDSKYVYNTLLYKKEWNCIVNTTNELDTLQDSKYIDYVCIDDKLSEISTSINIYVFRLCCKESNKAIIFVLNEQNKYLYAIMNNTVRIIDDELSKQIEKMICEIDSSKLKDE